MIQSTENDFGGPSAITSDQAGVNAGPSTGFATEVTVSGESAITAPTPRRRGRPRKDAAIASEASASADNTVAGSADSNESAEDSKATKSKGRAKAKAEKNVNAESELSPQSGSAYTMQPMSSESLSLPVQATFVQPLSLQQPAPVEMAVPSKDSRKSKGGSNGSSNNNGSNNNGGGKNNSNGGHNNQGGSGGKKGYQNQGRRPRRNNYNNPREQVVPQTSREDLENLKVAELREKAVELELDISAIKKKEELIEAVLEAMVKAEGFVGCEGILDLLPEGYGFLRTTGYLPGELDVYVGMSMVRRNGLRKGDKVSGQVRPARDNEKYAALHRIDTVNGQLLEESRGRRRFADLTPVYPDDRLLMEHGSNTITARTIDLVAPIGKGQRGLIVSPPKAGKTTILKDIAASISANNPDVHLMCLLVDERPEEVTDMERSIKGEVVSSTFDMPSENHIAVAELVIERAKRLVEIGMDVVILLDSITRLARAYNLAQPASGRILSGGVDSTALYPPKRFLGAARNIEGGGSLTILASALIETGSKMDEVIFEEFKGTGNMELRLDRDLADRRIFPAIDPVASGTRKEELLLDAQEAPLIWAVRRILANMNNTERAMEMLIKSLKQTQNNAEFLMRTAKKAQTKSNTEIAEL
jgi:transcription termination factor Rho